jgi:drug/metabolite transporter (DMT)-like permease
MLTPERRELIHQAFRLEWLTVAWMIVEGGVAVAAGVVAGSPTLLAFGLDSVIELLSAAALLAEVNAEGGQVSMVRGVTVRPRPFAIASTDEIAVQIVYQGVLMSCVALIAFNRAVSLLGATAATAIIALLPATATALAAPALHEIPSPAECAAFAVVVIGVLLVAGTVRVPAVP